MSMLPPFQTAPLQEVVQHHPVDLAVHAHAHVVILPVHEVGERGQALVNASAMFFTVWSDTMMVACAAKPRPTIICPLPAAMISPDGPPVRPPAQSKQESPVQLAVRPCASTMPTWRCAGRGSVRITMRIAPGALAPRAISPRPLSP